MELQADERDTRTAEMLQSGWHGTVALTYDQQGDRTVPRVQTRSPLKMQRPFYPEGAAVCHSVLLHTAGGMVGGDRLTYDIQLQAGTQALVTTAAAAKIYTDHPLPARVDGTMRLDAGACLEWLPQDIIVFEGAQYHQTWRIELAPGAHWLGWDIMRLGRTARGERFTRGNVRSRCEVWHDGRLIWLDPQRLVGSEAMWSSPHALNGCPVIATLAWVGAHPDKSLVTAIREAWAAIPDPRGEAGVSRLQLGLLCRYRGQSTRVARSWLIDVWQHLRQHYKGQSVCVPRVWQF